MNIKEVKESLPILFEAKVTPLLIGHRGTGKSECIKQYAEENGYTLVDLRLGQMADAGDLVGLADFLEEGGKKIATKFMQPHYLPQNGKCIIFLDEINRASKDILQAVFELVYDRSISINGYKLPEGSQIVAAMNPPTEDYTVLDFNDAAFQDRFCHIKFEPTLKDWIDYSKSIDADSFLLDFIKEQPEMLEPKLEDFSISSKPSRRSWLAVDRIKKLSTDSPLFEELTIGMVGMEAAIPFCSFLKEKEKIITGRDVLDNYDVVKDFVEKYSENESNRSDILRNIGDRIKEELVIRKKLTKVTEENLVEFLITIPKDLAFNLINEFMKIDSFKCTESDEKYGLMGNKDGGLKKSSKHVQKLCKHFKLDVE